MNCIDVHPTKKGTAYIAATAYKFGDYTPYLFKTDNYGKSWKLITNGIPSTYYTRAIRADKTRDGLLYAGTEWGMFISFDDGANWQAFQMNLPIVAIRDLHVRDNMLIAATHGRSFWMIDDLSPLHQLSDAIAKKGFHLYQPKPAYRMAQSGGWGRPNMKLVGENHPNGVLFNFFVKDVDEKTKATLEIMEMDGDIIKTYKNKAKKRGEKLRVNKGGNRFVWDMRYTGFKDFPGMVLYSSPNRGPKAVPGKYKARLTVNGKSVEQTFEIIPDPRLKNTAEDYQKQFDFLVKVRDKVSEAHQAIRDIRSVRKDIKYLKDKLGDDEQYQPAIKLAEELDEEMTIIENNIHETRNQSRQDPLNFGIRINNHLAFLLADQQRGDFPPTDQAEAVRKERTAALDKELNALNQLMKEKLGDINNLLESKGFKLLNGRVEAVN